MQCGDSLLSAEHVNLTSERPPTEGISVKTQKINKEVVFSWRWVSILLTMLDRYSIIKFGWCLLTDCLCSEVIYT